MIFSGYVPSSGTAGPHGNFIPSVLRNPCTGELTSFTLSLPTQLENEALVSSLCCLFPKTVPVFQVKLWKTEREKQWESTHALETRVLLVREDFPSSDCRPGRCSHGCVPWQYCLGAESIGKKKKKKELKKANLKTPSFCISDQRGLLLGLSFCTHSALLSFGLVEFWEEAESRHPLLASDLSREESSLVP